MNNHWQLKTTPVSNKEEDKLSHDSIAELLKEKIDYLFSQDDIPSCICLNGEYGSGKSTIINLLLKKWEGATNRKVVHFNIWRHKDENTYYALFRNIFYALRNKENSDFRKRNFLETLTETEEIQSLDIDFAELVYASFSRKEVDQSKLKEGVNDFVSNLPRYVGSLTWGLVKVVLIAGFCISLVGFIIDLAINQKILLSVEFAGKLFLLVITSTTILSFLFKNIFKNIPSLFKLHIQQAENSVTLPSISNTEQLQCIFRNMLHKYCNNGENKKLVIVVEDVDRKHNDEIIKTLNELRTFIDLGKAIFIIPCDLNNIERAFIESGIDKSNELDERYIKWKAKDFYSKIFSHVVTIPIQCQQDLRGFLINKINNESENHPINNYLKENDSLSSLVNILLVYSIKTPREAINIFNRFTLQFEHALKLEKESNRLNSGTISNNVLAYARVYILSTYYGLEKELLKYPELIDWVLHVFRGRDYAYKLEREKQYTCFNKVPGYALSHVRGLYNGGVIIPEIEEFISRTDMYSSDLVKPFIYLDETSYSGIVGNEIYNVVLNSLNSRNTNKLKHLLEESNKEISEVIHRVTENVTYDADFQTILPSLIEIFILLREERKRPVSNFILEHFKRLTDKELYAYDPDLITEIFKYGNAKYTDSAKRKYYNVLNKDKDSITEYCSEVRVFDISVSLINALKVNVDYVDVSICDLLKEFVSIPVKEELEYMQRAKYLEIIDNSDLKLIAKLFDVTFLERCVSNISNFYEISRNQKQLKSSINKLIDIFIQDNKSRVVESINKLIGYVDVEVDSWYLELLNKYNEYFKSKEILLPVLSSLHSNLFIDYLNEDVYERNTKFIENAIREFSKLHNYTLNTLGIKGSKGYSGLLSLYTKEISNSKSVEYLAFVLKMIHLHESNGSLNFYNNLIETFVEFIKSNLWVSNKDSNEFQKTIIIAKFLVQNNRITNLKEENQNMLRDVLMDQLRTNINHNTANSEQSETVFEFIKELNYAPKFDDLLVSWLESKTVSINSDGNPLSIYRDYLKVFELVKYKLSDDYTANFLSRCSYLITNYAGNSVYAEPAWRWLSDLVESNSELPIYKNNVVPTIFNQYDQRTDKFVGIIKYYVCKVLYSMDLYENENYKSQYINLLIWAADEYNDLVDLFETEFRVFSIDKQYEGLSLISRYEKWNVLEEMMPDENDDLEKLAIHILLQEQDKGLVANFYNATSTKLNWGKVISEVIKTVSIDKKINYASFLNEMSNEIIGRYDKSTVNGEVEEYVIELLKEGFDTKFIALDLIDKLELNISGESDLLYSVISDFVNIIDVNTEFKILKELKEWLKKHRLTRKSNINDRLREIAKVLEGEKLMEIESLIKY